MATPPTFPFPSRQQEIHKELTGERDYLRLKQLRKWAFWGGALFTALFFALYLYSTLVPLPPVQIYQTTTFYSYDGKPITQMTEEGINREVIPLSEIPESIIMATLAVEDRTFYRHHGFNFKRIVKAAWEDLKAMEMVQGASTITQQLARNLYLSHEKTLERKLKEALITLQLEAQLDKEEILARYLNQIYYGESAYGIEAAAQTYFGKEANELTLAEAALLVGIPKNPAAYSPFKDWQAAKGRQKEVLQIMAETGLISKATALQAVAEEIRLQEDRALPKQASYFVDTILWEAQEKYGLNFEQLKKEGLHVYTTLDLKMQQAAEKKVSEQLAEYEDLQAALVAIEPSTGAIRALIGGKNYEESQYNRALALRQPGSSFKAFLYASAVENGWTATTLLKSEPTVFTTEGGTYQPHNFGNQYPMKPITLRDAVTHSDNIYAVKTHLLLGEEKLVNMAWRLGITSPLKPLPSLALGTEEVTPLDMAAAFATLANQGKRIRPSAIVQITDTEGHVLAEAKPRIEQVISSQVAYITTNLLESVLDEGGTGSRVRPLLDRPAAAKTGTTDFDAWMVGFTPELVTAVWVGHDDHTRLSTMESRQAAPIWANFISEALKGKPPTLFTPPQGVISTYIDPETGMIASENCPVIRLEVFIEGTEPQEVCTVHHLKTQQPSSSEPTQRKKPWQQIWNWLTSRG